jgi:flagellar basal-body rod modification protein FlgD
MTSISSVSSGAGDIRSDYLQLLITQLQHQDPLDPMDNNQMSMQLAQMSQLEQLENMSSTFQKVLLATQVNQATELIGKVVSWIPADGGEQRIGRVDGVDLSGSKVQVKIGAAAIDPDLILSIQN